MSCAKLSGCRLGVCQEFAKAQDYALRPLAGARRKKDHRVVVPPAQHARHGHCSATAGEKRVSRGRTHVPSLSTAPAPAPAYRRAPIPPDRAPARFEPRKNIAELIAVHLHMHGADRCAVSHHAEIGQDMLNEVSGEQRDAVVAANTAIPQEGGNPPRHLAQFAVGYRATIFGTYDPGLWGRPRWGAVDPISQQCRGWSHRNPKFFAAPYKHFSFVPSRPPYNVAANAARCTFRAHRSAN